MTPRERKHLQKLDDLVLNTSPEELTKIQEVDYHKEANMLFLQSLSFLQDQKCHIRDK